MQADSNNFEYEEEWNLNFLRSTEKQIGAANVPYWLKHNGADLTSKRGESWCCLHLVSGTEFLLAKILSKQKIRFFLPLVEFEEKSELVPLWPNYIFCRLSENQFYKVIRNRRVLRILHERFEEGLLEHLRGIAPISMVLKSLQKGVEVQINDGPFFGYEGQVIDINQSSSELIIRLNTRRFQIEASFRRNQIQEVESSSNIGRIVPHIEVAYSAEPEKEKDTRKNKLTQIISLELSEINEQLVNYLKNNPEKLYELEPRKFEKLIAHLLADMGCDVELTPQSRDGGRDIMAAIRLPIGELLTIVECKKYSAEHKVGIDIAERFLFAIDRKDCASYGVIATTSYFTKDVQLLQKEFNWRLGLKDFDCMKEWLENYGRWETDLSTGLWVPNSQMLHV